LLTVLPLEGAADRALSTAPGLGALRRSRRDRERIYLCRVAYSRAETVYRNVFRKIGSMGADEPEPGVEDDTRRVGGAPADLEPSEGADAIVVG